MIEKVGTTKTDLGQTLKYKPLAASASKYVESETQQNKRIFRAFKENAIKLEKRMMSLGLVKKPCFDHSEESPRP